VLGLLYVTSSGKVSAARRSARSLFSADRRYSSGAAAHGFMSQIDLQTLDFFYRAASARTSDPGAKIGRVRGH
jgi:hypothetical protein